MTPQGAFGHPTVVIAHAQTVHTAHHLHERRSVDYKGRSDETDNAVRELPPQDKKMQIQSDRHEKNANPE